MRISVIIPAINEVESIARSVRSARMAGAFEVIVVDGGSHDETRVQAANAGARSIPSAAGRGLQQNVGASAAAGEVLLFLHADSQLGANCLQQISAIQPWNQSIWGAFRQRIDAEGMRFRWLEWGNAQRIRRRGLPFGDQAIFIHRALFDQLGGFPELPIMEDYLFAKRARRVTRPLLLPGPVHTSARRWLSHGVVRQTLKNWLLVLATECGVSPLALARHYRRHDEPAGTPRQS